MSHTTLAQGVSARHAIHVSCACVFDLSSTLSSHSSFVSSIFLFILLFFIFIFHVDWFDEKSHAHSRELRRYALWPRTILSQSRQLGKRCGIFDGTKVSHEEKERSGSQKASRQRLLQSSRRHRGWETNMCQSRFRFQQKSEARLRGGVFARTRG